MSTATVSAFTRSNALMGTYGSTALSPSSSLLGLVAAEVSKLFRKTPKAPMNRAQEAEALRLYAADFEHDDPRFADDLYAAAARHEELV